MRKSFVKWFSMFKYFTKNTAGRANIWQRKKRYCKTLFINLSTPSGLIFMGSPARNRWVVGCAQPSVLISIIQRKCFRMSPVVT